MIRFAFAPRRPGPVLRGVLCGLAGLMLLGSAANAASPQPVDDDEAPASVSHPVIEPTGPSAGKALNTALERLARDPRNVTALIDAGNAANALGDNEAALGFFNRANQIAPGNGMVKTAMAGARLHLGDPVEALRMYAEAEAGGADPASFALDRGLAFDLVGDNAAAQAQYHKVLDRSADQAMRDEALRREAISLAIGGDRRAADRAILPLLQRQDRAAWRAHIFVLAIAGRSDDAVAVAHATMPDDLANAIGPYLRFMVQLTPAQQAAAAVLGKFPRAADIGRDDPAVVTYAATHPMAPHTQHALLTPTVAGAPASVLAAEAAENYARTTHAKRRRGHDAPAAPAATTTALIDPEPVLPPPPPPPPLGNPGRDVASATRMATPQSSANPPDNAPAIAAVVPHPAIPSRLDLPPTSRHNGIRPAVAPVRIATVTPAPVPPANDTPQPDAVPVPVSPPPPAPTPALTNTPGIWSLPVPGAAAAPDTGIAAVPTVSPTPTPPVAAKPVMTKAPPVKTAHADPAAGDKPGSTKTTTKTAAKTKETPAKSASEDTAKDKVAASKAAKGKLAKKDAADVPLAPCKPASTIKGRKGKAVAAKDTHSRKSKPSSRHGSKAKADTTDTDTCVTVARGERPDAPGGVSRDADSEDSHATKTKGKGHDKTAEKSADKATDKTSEKGGRHARYASRIWVEVLTGADRDKMPNEWRALVRKTHALKKHKPYITPWRSNFRLLTGPFDSDADAQDFIAELRKDGVSGFEWTSPAGQAVDSLPVP